MALAPRKILHLEIPEIKAGLNANFSIIDPDIHWQVDSSKFKSKSFNSPFIGWNLTGRAFGVFNKGMWYHHLE